MKIERLNVLTLTSIALILFLAASCNSPVEPDPGTNPSGNVVAWFNGLANTIDLYFPESDFLVSTAYITGDAPNDLLYLGSDKLVVLSSLSSILQVVDLSVSGSLLHEIAFPGGSNPWAMAYENDKIWVTLMLTGQIAAVSTDSWTPGETVDVTDYPYGIAIASGSIFVSHGDYTEPNPPGGVTVLDAITLEETGWIDTGQNTIDLWYCSETGNIHAFSYTYSDDGVISIIDPASCTILSQIATGGSPGKPVQVGSHFASGDGWSSDAIFFYNEAGTLLDTWNTGVNATGLAVSGDTLYITDFNTDMVYIADWNTQVILDSLVAGNGPQGIISIER